MPMIIKVRGTKSSRSSRAGRTRATRSCAGARPDPRRGPWTLGALAVAAAAAVRRLADRDVHDARPQRRAVSPASSYAATSRRLRLRPLPQRARAGAARARLRRRLHGRLVAPDRRRGLQRHRAQVHDKAGPLAIGFVILATTVLARHPGLRARPRRLRRSPRSCTCRPAAAARRPAPARAAGADRAVPAARRVDASPAAAGSGTICSPRRSSPSRSRSRSCSPPPPSRPGSLRACRLRWRADRSLYFLK